MSGMVSGVVTVHVCTECSHMADSHRGGPGKNGRCSLTWCPCELRAAQVREQGNALEYVPKPMVNGPAISALLERERLEMMS